MLARFNLTRLLPGSKRGREKEINIADALARKATWGLKNRQVCGRQTTRGEEEGVEGTAVMARSMKV